MHMRTFLLVLLVISVLTLAKMYPTQKAAALPAPFKEIGGKEIPQLIQNQQQDESIPATSLIQRGDYTELVGTTGYVNSEPFELGDFIGKKVILVSFMTYSCINCQRTMPLLNKLYDTYRGNGLVVVGIHTPEFAFEHNIDNVRRELNEQGVRFPVVLDNNYSTWRAYNNSYWPARYLINLEGNVSYYHAGEGAYIETASKIEEALGISQ